MFYVKVKLPRKKFLGDFQMPMPSIKRFQAKIDDLYIE